MVIELCAGLYVDSAMSDGISQDEPVLRLRPLIRPQCAVYPSQRIVSVLRGRFVPNSTSNYYPPLPLLPFFTSFFSLFACTTAFTVTKGIVCNWTYPHSH